MLQADLETPVIAAAIKQGVSFLLDHQLPSGEFPTFVAETHQLNDGAYYASPFITSFVLYAVFDLDQAGLADARQKALMFLQQEQLPNGGWCNHTLDNVFHQLHRLPSDLDDTATVSFCLKSHGITFAYNAHLFEQNRNAYGLYETWIDPPFGNEIDALVNANILLYLGRPEPEVISYIKQVVLNNVSFSRWYPERTFFFYMIARAYQQGLNELGEVRPLIIEAIKQRYLANDGCLSPLALAMGLVTLMIFSDTDANGILTRGIEYLIKLQGSDGGWPRSLFFNGFDRFYGAEGLTTAIAVQALHRYQQRND